MGQFVVERRRRLHRGRQLHELLVAGPGHVLELALKRTHRIETVREVFEMAADGLYRLEGSGHIRELLLEGPDWLEDISEKRQLTHRLQYLG